MVAAHQQGNQRVAATFNGFNQQRFDGLLNRQVELLDQLSDGFRIRRIDQGHLLSCRRTRRFRRNGFSKLNVGREVRAVREDHVIFAALRQNLELMRRATAD